MFGGWMKAKHREQQQSPPLMDCHASNSRRLWWIATQQERAEDNTERETPHDHTQLQRDHRACFHITDVAMLGYWGKSQGHTARFHNSMQVLWPVRWAIDKFLSRRKQSSKTATIAASEFRLRKGGLVAHSRTPPNGTRTTSELRRRVHGNGQLARSFSHSHTVELWQFSHDNSHHYISK